MKKFSVRDLFWLVLVVAMGLGWWADRSRQAQEIERVNTALWGERGATVRLIHELRQKDGWLPPDLGPPP